MTQTCDDVWLYLHKAPDLRHLLERQLADQRSDETEDHPSHGTPGDGAPQPG